MPNIEDLLQHFLEEGGEEYGDYEDADASGTGNVEIEEHDEEEGDEDYDDDDAEVFTIVGNTFRVRIPAEGIGLSSRYRLRRPRRGLENLEPVPSEAGRELMASGEFGFVR